MRYRLTAKLDGRTQYADIDGEPDPILGPHFDATCEAIKYVLTRGSYEYRTESTPLWSKGEITLRDQYGEVVHHMEAKQ